MKLRPGKPISLVAGEILAVAINRTYPAGIAHQTHTGQFNRAAALQRERGERAWKGDRCAVG